VLIGLSESQRHLVVVHLERAHTSIASSALDLPRAVSAVSMKKAKAPAKKSRASGAKKPVPRRRTRAAEMRPEYDFSGGVRGKYARAYARGSNVIVLAPDLAAEFRSASAVNRALRAYLKARSSRRTA
jgi:hypothetical protein